MRGRLESINVSGGGVPKTSVFEALITESGLSHDRQTDLRYHGGPDRAVVLYSLEVIDALQLEGHPIHIGRTGENLTISGLEWLAIVPGVELQIGAVRLHVTKYAAPCSNIRGSFLDGNFARISHKVHPGWSRICARVVSAGIVRPHDPVDTVSMDGG